MPKTARTVPLLLAIALVAVTAGIPLWRRPRRAAHPAAPQM